MMVLASTAWHSPEALWWLHGREGTWCSTRPFAPGVLAQRVSPGGCPPRAILPVRLTGCMRTRGSGS